MKRPLLRLIGALATIFVLVITLLPLGCGSSGQGALKIGCLVPITGSMAGRFDDAKYALEWLAEDINEGNHELSTTATVDGKTVSGLKVGDTIYKIEVIVEDATSENIYSGMLKLAYEDGVVAAFGSGSSTGLFNVQPIVEGEGLVFVSLAGSPTADNMKYKGADTQFQFICTTLSSISIPATYNAMFNGIDGYDAPFSRTALGITEDRPVKVYVIDIDDAGGQDRQTFSQDWEDDNPTVVEHLDFNLVSTGETNWGPVVTNAMADDPDVIVSGGLRQVDLVGLIKELRGVQAWTGPVLQTSGGARWEELTDGVGTTNIALLENFYQRFVPPTIEDAGDEFEAYLGTQEDRPEYIDALYDKANESPVVAAPVELVKYYGVAQALLEAIQTAQATTPDLTSQMDLTEALGQTTVWDLFQELEWGGQTSYGRTCALDYTNHYGKFKDDGTMEWILPLVYITD